MQHVTGLQTREHWCLLTSSSRLKWHMTFKMDKQVIQACVLTQTSKACDRKMFFLPLLMLHHICHFCHFLSQDWTEWHICQFMVSLSNHFVSHVRHWLKLCLDGSSYRCYRTNFLNTKRSPQRTNQDSPQAILITCHYHCQIRQM